MKLYGISPPSVIIWVRSVTLFIRKLILPIFILRYNIPLPQLVRKRRICQCLKTLSYFINSAFISFNPGISDAEHRLLTFVNDYIKRQLLNRLNLIQRISSLSFTNVWFIQAFSSITLNLFFPLIELLRIFITLNAKVGSTE